MSSLTIAVFVFFLIFWLYTVISIFSSEFKEKKAKTFWVVGILLVPFLAFFYLYMKKDLLS